MQYIFKKSIHFLFISLASCIIYFPVLADFNNNLPLDYPTQQMSPKKTSPDLEKNNKNKTTKSLPSENKTQTTPSAQSVPANNNPGPFSSELGNHDSNAPVYFSGKHGDGSRKTGILNLVGDAVIIQDDTTLKSNIAKIFSLPGTLPTPGTSRIQRALAIGDVRIYKKQTPTSPEIRATGDETEFLVANRILILRGKAKVWRINEYLNGDVIKISLNSGDVDVIRPEGTVDPRSANNNLNNKTDNNKPQTTSTTENDKTKTSQTNTTINNNLNTSK